MERIVTLTINPTIDKSTSVDSVASEIKLRCDEPEFHPGGGGINVTRAVKKLGGDSIAVYPAGGPTGQLLRMLLDEEVINQQVVVMQGMTRESLTVFEKSTTLQYRFGMPGPEMSQPEWEACMEKTFKEGGRYIVASGSLPPGVPVDFYGQLARRANMNNARVIVDTSGAALHQAVEAGIYLLKPNLRELEIFNGGKILGEDHLKKVCRGLIEAGKAEVIIVSMGAAGAALVTAELYRTFRAPLVPVQSKVGAGDSMVGGIVLALAQGRSLVEATRYGIAAGTAAVMTPGTALCRAEDTERLYKEISVE